MTNYQEEPSLLEVREWKERCRQRRSQLTDEEYLKKLQQLVEQVSVEYQLNLPTVTLSTVS
jgi:flagellar motor switch protein FliM